MKKVIRINNPTKIEDIKKAAKLVINQIEEGWESKLQKAKDEYHNLSWLGRWWHQNIKSFFTINNKFDALERAELEYKFVHLLQHSRCKDILQKLELIKSIDLGKNDCEYLWCGSLWEKSSKISVD